MSKTFFCLILVFAILSFSACKKSENKDEPQSGTPPSRERRNTPKETRRFPSDLELYKETNRVATISAKQFASLSTVKISVGKKQIEVTAVLLSDLLKKYNLAGKNVVFSGPVQSVSLTWDEAINSQIYVCQGRESLFRIFDKGRKVRLAGPLTKIQITDKKETATAKQSEQERI